MRKTINNTVLTKWINLHARVIEKPGTLMVNEFLYLLCNTVDKEEMVRFSQKNFFPQTANCIDPKDTQNPYGRQNGQKSNSHSIMNFSSVTDQIIPN